MFLVRDKLYYAYKMSLDIQATYIQVDNKGTEQTHAVLVGLQFIDVLCVQVKGKKGYVDLSAM